MKRILVFLVLSFIVPVLTFSQSTVVPEPDPEPSRIRSAIQGMIDSHKYKIGIFRILPQLGIQSGYDSNATYVQNEPIGDYYASFHPAVDVAVKLGNRAYIEFQEHLTLLWYRKLEERRDVQDHTRGKFVTGSTRSLVTFDGGYNRREDSYNDELDIPIQSKVADGGVTVDYSLSDKVQLVNSFRVFDSELEIDPDIAPLTFDPTDRRTYTYHFGSSYALRDTFHLHTDFSLGRSTALETDTTTQFWSVLQGATWSNNKLSVHGRVGYGQSHDVDSDLDANKHMLFGASVDYQLRQRLSVGAFVSRQFEFTVFSDDVTLITTAGGRASITIPITKRLSSHASYTAGYRFRDDDLVINGEPIDEDFFQTITGGASFRILRNLSLIGSASYRTRDSDVRELNNDRVIYSFGLGYHTNF